MKVARAQNIALGVGVIDNVHHKVVKGTNMMARLHGLILATRAAQAQVTTVQSLPTESQLHCNLPSSVKVKIREDGA